MKKELQRKSLLSKICGKYQCCLCGKIKYQISCDLLRMCDNENVTFSENIVSADYSAFSSAEKKYFIQHIQGAVDMNPFFSIDKMRIIVILGEREAEITSQKCEFLSARLCARSQQMEVGYRTPGCRGVIKLSCNTQLVIRQITLAGVQG